ncbi:MAG: hypothetical protein ACLUD2_05000 [Clostridium sp.]
MKCLETYHEGDHCPQRLPGGRGAALSGPGHVRGGLTGRAVTSGGYFRKGNFFLELQDHGIPDAETVNQGLMRMSRELSMDLVATNDIHYILAEDAAAHDILLCIQTGKKVSDENRMRYEGGQYYVQVRGRDAGAVPLRPGSHREYP